MRIDLKPPPWATHLQSDLTDWQRAPLAVAEMAPFDLPDDAYFEYAYVDAEGNRRPDPDNDNPRLNPWWEFASNIPGPDYRPDPWVAREGVRPRGRVLRMEIPSAILNQTRRVLVYSPAGRAEDELPLIIFQDGKAYYGWGRVPQVLDRMLEAGECGPAHLVFVPPRDRTPEYAFNPDYRRFLTEELLPAVESRIRCDSRRTVWGASLGGLLSAHLAWERPDLFQKVVTQSGAYLFSPDMDKADPFAGNEWLVSQVTASDPKPLQWHLDCGDLEWLLASNERMTRALAEKGASVKLVTRPAGHNWVNWRNGLAPGLRFALGAGA
ncbi:MAG: alpha/beta hydrolase-fold protein [Candidatus Krumholzibacteriota bacterium]